MTVGSVIEPIGGAACTFLRRVRLAGEPLHACPDELRLAQTCQRVGYLEAVPGRLGTFAITQSGVAYLDALARAH